MSVSYLPFYSGQTSLACMYTLTVRHLNHITIQFIVEQGFLIIVNENNLTCNEMDPVRVVLVVSCMPAL